MMSVGRRSGASGNGKLSRRSPRARASVPRSQVLKSPPRATAGSPWRARASQRACPVRPRPKLRKARPPARAVVEVGAHQEEAVVRAAEVDARGHRHPALSFEGKLECPGVAEWQRGEDRIAPVLGWLISAAVSHRGDVEEMQVQIPRDREDVGPPPLRCDAARRARTRRRARRAVREVAVDLLEEQREVPHRLAAGQPSRPQVVHQGGHRTGTHLDVPDGHHEVVGAGDERSLRPPAAAAVAPPRRTSGRGARGRPPGPGSSGSSPCPEARGRWARDPGRAPRGSKCRFRSRSSLIPRRIPTGSPGPGAARYASNRGSTSPILTQASMLRPALALFVILFACGRRGRRCRQRRTHRVDGPASDLEALRGRDARPRLPGRHGCGGGAARRRVSRPHQSRHRPRRGG